MVHKTEEKITFYNMEHEVIDNKSIYFILIKDENSYFIVRPFIDINSKYYEFEGCSKLRQYPEISKFIGVKNGVITEYSYSLLLSDNSLNEKEEYYLKIEVLKELSEYKQVQEFILFGKTLVFIQHPSCGNNLKVYDLDKKAVIHEYKSTLHPVSGYWPQIRLCENSEVIYRKKIGNILEITKKINHLNNDDKNSELKEITIEIPDVFEFEVYMIEKVKHLITIRLKSSESKKDKKIIQNYMISIFSDDDYSKPKFETAISQLHRCKITFDKSFSYCLIHSICDSSNNESYYGNSNLYFINLKNLKFKKIQTLKEGPIHDFCFSSKSDSFYVCCGYQPANVYCISCENPGKNYDVSTNVISSGIKFSPNGKILSLAALGSLNGDVNFLDVEKETIDKNKFSLDTSFPKIGKNNCFGNHEINWSQNSRFLLSTVLSPHLKVDNDIKIMTYNGENICWKVFDREIYEANWIYFSLYSDSESFTNKNNYYKYMDDFKIVKSKKNIEKSENNKEINNNSNNNKSNNKSNNNTNNSSKNSSNVLLQKPVFFNSKK